MIEAKKMNKVLKIEDAEADTYVALGFDIYEDGKLTKHGLGKTVPYERYEKVLKELETLKAEAKKETAKK